MAARLSTLGPLGSGLLLTLLGTVWLAHTSAYFMWGVVNQDTGVSVFIHANARVRPLLTHAQTYAGTARLLPVDPSLTRRLAISFSPDAQLLAAVPAVGHGQAVKNQLTQNGWTPRRLGGLIIAARGRTLPPAGATLTAGAGELLRHLGFDSLPLQPLIIARVSPGQSPVIPQGLRGVMFAGRHTLGGAVSVVDQWPKIAHQVVQENSSPVELEFSLPGRFLDALPADIKSQWQEDLWQKFGLNDSRPALLASLRSFDNLSVSLTPALGIRGQRQTARAQVEDWVQSEQGYRAPATVPFRLPDGTLGYEKRPGTSIVPWQSTPDGVCRSTAVGDTVYWLCQNADATSFARSEDGARHMLQMLADPITWHLRVGPPLSQRVFPAPVTSLTIESAGNDQAVFRLDTAD